MKAIFDLDWIIYESGFAGEKRSIIVTHTPSGRKTEFGTRTEFYGRDKKKSGGWLGDINKSREETGKSPFSLEEFEIEDKRTVDPVENVLHTVKMSINRVLLDTKADEYIGFFGGSSQNRIDRSSIWEYKGNRKDALKPILKEEIVEYLLKHHNAIRVTDGNEADDYLIIEALKDVENSVVITHDKDVLGCPVKSFNPQKPEKGIVDGRCFGELHPIYKDNSTSLKDVKGIGRKFFYFQLIYGDDVDNYRANSASDMDFGITGAFKALDGASNDREALEVVIDTYKMLYPEPKEIESWRGNIITVDWKYALRENWAMAYMLRSVDDTTSVDDILKRAGLEKEMK